MDFSLNEDQTAFKNAAIEFAGRELNEGAKQRERDREFNQAGWDKCAQFGIQGLTLPQRYGGLEMDVLASIAAMEGMGYACRDSGLLFSLNSYLEKNFSVSIADEDLIPDNFETVDAIWAFVTRG